MLSSTNRIRFNHLYMKLPFYLFSGYGCNDHFYESDTTLHSMQVLNDLLDDLDLYGIVVDVGMLVVLFGDTSWSVN